MCRQRKDKDIYSTWGVQGWLRLMLNARDQACLIWTRELTHVEKTIGESFVTCLGCLDTIEVFLLGGLWWFICWADRLSLGDSLAYNLRNTEYHKPWICLREPVTGLDHGIQFGHPSAHSTSYYRLASNSQRSNHYLRCDSLWAVRKSAAHCSTTEQPCQRSEHKVRW